MTNQEIDISQVLPGPCCGRYVPVPDEIDRILAGLGIERTAQHPEFTQEAEESFEDEGEEFESIALLQGMGNRLDLPNGTPRHFPPYPGATQRWSERTRQQVRRIRRKVPGIVCATYRNHGRTGQTWGVDIMVAPFNQKANAPQKGPRQRTCQMAYEQLGGDAPQLCDLVELDERWGGVVRLLAVVEARFAGWLPWR
jgi:hypothetical protein